MPACGNTTASEQEKRRRPHRMSRRASQKRASRREPDPAPSQFVERRWMTRRILRLGLRPGCTQRIPALSPSGQLRCAKWQSCRFVAVRVCSCKRSPAFAGMTRKDLLRGCLTLVAVVDAGAVASARVLRFELEAFAEEVAQGDDFARREQAELVAQVQFRRKIFSDRERGAANCAVVGDAGIETRRIRNARNTSCRAVYRGCAQLSFRLD